VIDTVSLRFHDEPTETQLEEWDTHHYSKSNGETQKKYILRVPIDGGVILRAIYYPRNPGFLAPMLKITFSVPKVLFGNNVDMLSDMEQLKAVIQIVNMSIALCEGMPTVDFWEGVLGRIDLCYNHQVGELVPDYIRSFSCLSYPHRKTRPYLNEGVQYKSQVVTTKFYDKLNQCRLPIAQGILRQETTLRKPYNIERRMGVSNPQLRDVKKEWIVEMLTNDLDKLRLNNHITCNRECAQEILVEEYGSNTGTRLLGYWIARQNMTKEQMIASGTNLRTIQRNEKMITDAGVSLAMTDATVPLPPLRIEV